MRAKDLIENGSPCDVDFTDKKILSLGDVERGGLVPCSNLAECQRRSRAEGIFCFRGAAMQMAGFILRNKLPFEQAVEKEKEDFLKDKLDGKFWVFRDGVWQVVEGKGNVIDEIVAFARLVIDLQPGERRPFTKDGTKSPEFGPADALHNAMLDLDDVYAEVGQKNPFR